MDNTSLYTKQDFEVAGCLRRLLRNRYILRSNNQQWFQKIIDYRGKLQEAMRPFFLQLIIDESLGVIHLSEIDAETEEFIGFSMGRKRILGAHASLLLWQLRHERLQFYLNPEQSTVPLVRREQLREYVREFDQNEVDARFERNFQRALVELKELQVLVEISGEEEIFEITSVCDLLLPLDSIQSYRQTIDAYFAQSNGSAQNLAPQESEDGSLETAYDG